MIYWLDEPRRRSEIVARRTFQVTLALSLLIHVAALVVVVQRTRIVSPGEGPELTTDRLQVRIAAAAPKAAPPPAPQAGAPSFAKDQIVAQAGNAPYVEIPHTGMRRTIATRLQKSFQNAPHIFFDAQIDAMAIEGLRDRVKMRSERLSVTAILVKACTWASRTSGSIQRRWRFIRCARPWAARSTS